MENGGWVEPTAPPREIPYSSQIHSPRQILRAVKIEVSFLCPFLRSERKHHQSDNFPSLPDFSMTSIQAARGIIARAWVSRCVLRYEIKVCFFVG